MNKATAFQHGNKFQFKDDENIYIFVGLDFKGGDMYVKYEYQGKEYSCIINSLSELKHA